MLEFRRRAELDEEAVQRLCAMGLPLRVAQLMVLRGVTTCEAAEKYLHPSLNELYDPFLLSGMQQAVDRIREAVAKKQRVCIYGDYDADGVTATSLLVLYFRTLGLNPGYYIPDRHEEGYGLNEHAVRELAAKYDLMVTVDCGVTAVKEVELCRQLGLDVLVTDHHHADTVLPDCVIVNPRLGGDPFPYRAGVGVAAKLVQEADKAAGQDAHKGEDVKTILTADEVVKAAGIDLVHFGIVCNGNILIGGLTPPVGSLMFTCVSITGCKMQEFIKECVPFIIALLIALLLLTYIPGISMLIPNLIY